MNNEEILPCPFCGSGDIHIAVEGTPIAGEAFCVDCGASAPHERWNSRQRLQHPDETRATSIPDGAAIGKDGTIYCDIERMRHWAEEYEACQMALDKAGVTKNDGDRGYNLWGRICAYRAMEVGKEQDVEAQIKSLLSCMRYDVREAAEKDLRALLAQHQPAKEQVRGDDELSKLIAAFSDFINEPPQYEDLRMVREYRHELWRKWEPLLSLLMKQAHSSAPSQVVADEWKCLECGHLASDVRSCPGCGAGYLVKALVPPHSIPEGYRLVPENPTSDMLAAIMSWQECGNVTAYRVMLSAAPTPPKQSGTDNGGNNG